MLDSVVIVYVGAFSDAINVVMTCKHERRNFCQAG